MRNDFNKRSNRTIIAALASAFVFALAALATGLALEIRAKSNETEKPSTANVLLVDAASGLNSTLSAMRLCVEREPAEELAKTALVYTVRAETALECDSGDWSECRAKEGFLNDVATVLHGADIMAAVKRSHEMYTLSTKFLEHLTTGAAFDYNGELAETLTADTDDKAPAATDEQKLAGKARIEEVLGATDAEYIGDYDGRIEFICKRNGANGYAVVENERIVEFSFEHAGSVGATLGEESAIRIAKECAAACGYAELKVVRTEINGGFGLVRMCREKNGAAYCDDCASVAISNGTAVAFSKGKCDTEHTPPHVKVDEDTARRSAVGAAGEGRLVARTVDGKERICYEYVYMLDDGAHYVYVCAESGKQMQVK